MGLMLAIALPLMSILVLTLQLWAELTTEADRFSSRSTRSRDLLQWAVGVQQRRRCRLFVPKTLCAQLSITPVDPNLPRIAVAVHAGAREGIIAEKSGGIISRYTSHC